MNRRSNVTILIAGLVLVLPIASASAGKQGGPSATLSSHGELSGRVLFEGPLPEEQWLPVWKHEEVCGKERPLGQHQISPSREVKNAVILLEAEDETLPTPRYDQAVAILDNRHCEFVPRVQVSRPHAALEVRNSDPILHSAHAFLEDGSTAFHVALPHFRDRTRTRLPGTGLLRIECDVGHTWMRAYILISSSPFVTVTGTEGTFQFRGIPPGHYVLRAWHEAFGSIEREIGVSKGKHTSLTLVFVPGNANRK